MALSIQSIFVQKYIIRSHCTWTRSHFHFMLRRGAVDEEVDKEGDVKAVEEKEILGGIEEGAVSGIHSQSHTRHKLSYPRMSRYTGDALARLRSRLWISLMMSRVCGSLSQHPSIKSYTSFGQVRGRCSTRPWVIHSITYKRVRSERSNKINVQKCVRQTALKVEKDCL